jgi:hypothetical protein
MLFTLVQVIYLFYQVNNDKIRSGWEMWSEFMEEYPVRVGDFL